MVLIVAAIALFRSPSADGPALETVDLTARPSAFAPALVPWREPERDLAPLFPGTSGYRTETLLLGALRLEILRRLGPNSTLRESALDAHRVRRANGTLAGTVLVRRAPGEYGAIELVVGVDPAGRVAGVRVQRQREPQPTAAILTSARWLGALRGKTAADAWRVGDDVLAVPPAARPSADALAAAVRALLVEFAVAEKARAAQNVGGHAAHPR